MTRGSKYSIINYMYTIPEAFKDFISSDCDRARFIQEYLKAGGLDSSIISLEGKNHIYVKFPRQQYNPMFRIKTVIAHYDRIGIGANDNSAAVFCLMEWARSLVEPALRQAQGPRDTQGPLECHNIRLIFTDGEELGESGGVAEQGAFPLAQMFRRLGITNNDVFVFDCMGRGDVPILAQAIVPPNVSTKFLQEFSDLELRAKNLLKAASGGKWFCLPCNYSDNASFIANGIPSVAITMLPSEEVETVLATGTCPTWQMFHTPQDNLQSLNPQSFELFHAILNKLTFLR